MRHLLLLASLLVVASATAQIGSQTQAVNPDVLALRNTSDLVIKDLEFTALAEVTFDLVNRGEVGVNVPARGPVPLTKSPAPTSGPPITIDIYMGGAKIASVYPPSIGGKQTRNFKVSIPSNVAKPKCLEARNLKVMVDPQNQVAELHDDNNVTEANNAARPCPDLAIKSIKRDKEGLLGETYRPKVTIINRGNAPSPSCQVWGTALSSAPGITGWPELSPTHTIPALAPGEETSFKIGGSVLSVDNTWVRIMLDRFFQIEESDENNNWKDEKL